MSTAESPSPYQRPKNITDMIAAALGVQNPMATALTNLGVFALLDETLVGVLIDTLTVNPSNQQTLLETLGESDALQQPPKACTAFRLDSAGAGKCGFSLDADFTDGGGQLDF